MFGWKAKATYLDAEVRRLQARIADLEQRNTHLVDRLLAKNYVPEVNSSQDLPLTVEGVSQAAIFEDIEEKTEKDFTDNRFGEKLDVFAG